MKKVLFFLLTVVISLNFSSILAKNTTISLFNKTTYDFGTIEEKDGPITIDIDYNNISKQDIKFDSIKSVSKNLEIYFASDIISPNTSGEIKVTVNPEGVKGDFKESINVILSNGEKIFLEITGKIKPIIIDLDPDNPLPGIKVNQLQTYMNRQNPVLIDLRDKKAFELAHLSNAKHFDFNNKSFLRQIEELNPLENYVLYSETSEEAIKAQKSFKESGFKSVYHLEGGYKAWKEEQNKPSPDKPETLLKKLNETQYKLVDILIDTEKKEVQFPAEVNMTDGPIEVLITSKNGKEHEAVLVTDVIPSHLQVALLLLDFECGQKYKKSGNFNVPVGDPLIVTAEWENENKEIVKVNVENLVFNVATKKPMQKTTWTFLGSKFEDIGFMADVDKTIISTYHNPYTILENPLRTGADDSFYMVNNDMIPPKDTPIKITIRNKRN